MLNIYKQFGRARVEKKLSMHTHISDFKEETHTQNSNSGILYFLCEMVKSHPLGDRVTVMGL